MAPDQEQNIQGTLPSDQAAELADMFRLLGDVNRLRIVCLCLGQPMAVGDMATQLGLSMSLVSHHLRLLRAARLLRAERRGKNVIYQPADGHIHSVITDMLHHVAEPSDEA